MERINDTITRLNTLRDSLAGMYMLAALPMKDEPAEDFELYRETFIEAMVTATQAITDLSILAIEGSDDA